MRRTITIPNRFIISTTSWLAKQAGLFLVILLLLSCEDNTGLVGFKNPNRDFEVFQKEFTIPTTTFLMDSVSTSNSASDDTTRLMVGFMDDARFGKTTATAYTQYLPIGAPLGISPRATYQRLELTMVFDYYWQGNRQDNQETYNVYEVTDSILTYLPHFSNKSTPYGALVGTTSKIVSPNAFEKNKDSNVNADVTDDILDSLNISLDDNLGKRLFTAAMDTIGDNELEYLIFSRFRRNFKGLAVVGGPDNNKIVGFNPTHAKSRMTLHYTIDTTKYQLTYSFMTTTSNGVTAYPSYTELKTDRSGTAIEGLNSYYTDTEPSDGLRYIQSGTGVAVKLDLTEVRDHFKNIPVKAFSVAELRIETEQQTSPPARFLLRALKPNNRTLSAVKGDVDAAGDNITVLDGSLIVKHAISQTSLARLEPVSDNGDGSPFTLRLISNTGGASLYTGNLTTFLQQETTLGDTDFLRYYALIPQVPANAKSVNGFYFAPDKIKLKIYYTTPGDEE